MRSRRRTRTTAVPTAEELGFALVHLARVSAEEAAAGSEQRLKRFIPRAVTLIIKHAEADFEQLKNDKVLQLAAEVAELLRAHARKPLTRDVFDERLDELFECYGWGLGWLASPRARQYAWSAQKRSSLNQGPVQVAAEVVGLALRIAPRTIYLWKKRAERSVERERRKRALLALNFFVSALMDATAPAARTVLRDVQALVDAELARRTP